MNGLVLIDKPAGCTSHDVVNRWRKLAKTKRAGHLGTLDPMATGLLVLMTGSATRLAQFLGRGDKTYVAEIQFGLISDTYDAEGEIVPTGRCFCGDSALLTSALNAFRGRFFQTPPPVSAKKVNGIPAYKLARNKERVELKPVEVEVKTLEIGRADENTVELVVTCSAGTYIRSLAHDLGGRLGCGAILSKLQRTRAGEFALQQARSLEELRFLAECDRLSEAVIPSRSLLPHFPSQYFDSLEEARIRQGRDFRTSPFVIPPGTPYVKALSHNGELIAIGQVKLPNLYHPSAVF